MGRYLLKTVRSLGPKADMQRAEEILDRWRKKDLLSFDIASPETDIRSVWLEDNVRLLLKLEFKPRVGTRKGFIIIATIGLALCEVLTLIIPSLINSAISSHSIVSIGILLALTFFWIVTGTIPFIYYNFYRGILRSEEFEQLSQDFVENGIEVTPLTNISYWLFFPGDSYLIQSGAWTLFFIQIFNIFGLGNIILLILPLLLYIFVNTAINLLQEYSFRKALDEVDAYSYWKVEVIKATRQLTTLSFFSLCYYLLIYNTAFVYLTFFWIVPTSPMGPPPISSLSALEIILNEISSANIYYVLGQMKNKDIALSIIRTTGAFNSPFITLFFILTILLMFFYYRFWFSRGFFTKDFLTGKDINPNSAPRIKPGKSTKLVNVYIIFNWLFTFSLNALNLAILGITILWIYNGNSDWLPARWIVPLIWYQAVIQNLLGESIGRLVTIFLLIGIFTPILLWLLMYIFSLLKTCKRVLISLLSFKRVNRLVKTKTHYLCNQLNISSPYLYIDNTEEGWPKSIPLLPTSRFCIINLSNRLVTELTEKQLTLILAHELAHTTLHVKKLWIMQLLSRISIVGPGYLTLLLDYRKMELEADAFSVYVTGDRQAFIELLDKKDLLDARIRLHQMVQQHQRTENRANLSYKKKGIIFGVKELYKFHFENALWGYLYPLPQERSLRLRCRFDLLTENSRQVIELAEREAKRLQHNIIGIEHLLSGLIQYKDDEVVHVLQMLGIETARILDSIKAIEGDKTVYGDIGLTLFTENARRALELAGEEADRLGHKHLSPLLILLGLLSVDEGVVANVLTSQGINLVQARQEVLTLLK